MKGKLASLLILLLALLAVSAQAQWAAYDEGDVVFSLRAETRLEIEQQATWQVEVPEAGEYHVVLRYRPIETTLFDATALITLNGQQVRTPIPFLWKDGEGALRQDKYGNQIPPDQVLVTEEISAYVESYTTFSRRPVPFALEAGTHTLTFLSDSVPLLVIGVELVRAGTIPDYADYIAQYESTPPGQDALMLEAERYAYKSDSFIRSGNVNNTAVHPSDPYVKLLNAIIDKSYKTAGQSIVYAFDIETPGFYAIALKYTQPMKAGMPVFRTVEIDGQAPFAECYDVPFSHTGMNRYENLIVGGGSPYLFYLGAGEHTLTVKVTAQPLDTIYTRLTDIIGEMNSTTLQIKKLTGQNSDVTSNIDVNRTWNVLDYMPTILEDITAWQEELSAMYEQLREISGQEPSFASDMALAIQNLERLKQEPEKLPNKITLLGDDASSAAQLLGTLLPKLSEQNMGLDCLYIYNGQDALPAPDESFGSGVATGFKQFAYSFSPVMNESATRQEDGKRLTVWVNKSSQYVEVMRDLCAKTFTEETGIDVTFSIMPQEDKLILSNASGKNPDVVLGTGITTPFNFAVRGIAKNLLEYEDFLDWYGAEYNLEALVPYSFDGGIYGACETAEFRVLFYRKDILDMLGLSVPQTMDEVRAMMPTLHRNAMNFSMPLSTDKEGYKGFQQTMPFVYQRGGDIYSEDGMHASLTDPKTVQGLADMCDMYKVYGCLTNVKSFFNSFRSGAIPLGISDYGTYLQLQTAAPEMAGLWDIALVPGEPDADGNILRYQAATDTGAMIFDNTNMPDEAYAFIKWWLSSTTQADYANDLQRKYGTEYKWNTANLVAFAQMPFPKAHKDTIITMLRDWQKETPRHIAVYMLEREISDLWGKVVKQDDPLMPCIDQAQKNIDREIQRKMIEFGYMDEDGNTLKPYNNNTVEQLKGE